MELRRKNNPWLPLLLVSHLLVSVAFSSSWGAHDAPAPADGSHGKGKDKGTHHHETANGTSGDCGRKKHHHHGAGGRDGQRVRGPPAATSNPWIVSPGPPASTAGAAPRPYASEFITAATGVVLVAGGVGWLLVCA